MKTEKISGIKGITGTIDDLIQQVKRYVYGGGERKLTLYRITKDRGRRES